MNHPLPFPEDHRLFEIHELGARMTVAETKDARVWLWGELRGKIDEYLRDVTATAGVGKGVNR
ncbi:hypothetical protein [Paraburkholderia rhynchosiae]|uniref:Uncharacterized protein n=1 Tax=Paraburkholderia rhynchosiae TaxID=487049 RepID=A0A2N7W999_9BURK|nr:hypothetical protein [Paraburkholderia rhynchosiae]PMS25975.1 hypothetical protein C0Z16_27970 [Paraburkholderia rhynchosiae]CAB3730685.1 hypothetical protein LMG27174_05769 [Paraburkholderia rhynchosiae]